MRRNAFVYMLIAAVVIAASGLAYYGYSFSRQLSVRERAIILDTMRELAEEKVIGIESELIKADHAIFQRIDVGNPMKLHRFFESERPAITSVVILDNQLAIVPGGFFTKRRGERLAEFRALLEQTLADDLALTERASERRQHLHIYYNGRPYLFSYVKRSSEGRTFYVISEADLDYLVGTVFPQFFAVRSPRRYQVVDSEGELVYGFDFATLADAAVVEMPFLETVSRWRLRVAQRDPDALGGGDSRLVLDLVSIGSALVVILVGLAVLLMGLYRERRANELKSEFISNVSHELKTPLSIISMFGEMLALGRTKSAEQATEYAEIIWRESMRLARLIDNVLDFAKIERGVDAYEFAMGDLGEVVSRAVELSLRRVHAAGMEISIEEIADIPELSIDANALTLAVLNLIDNAVKYAADGKRIEVRLCRGERGIELKIRDFGPGIDSEEQGRIFERFYRARAVRLKPIRGSGIGLALVRHIAEAHGGDIEVDSSVKTGAAFRLWIPASRRE